LFRHSVFANGRISWGNSPIGEKLVDIRQLAKSTIGEKEDWRWDITPMRNRVVRVVLLCFAAAHSQDVVLLQARFDYSRGEVS